MSSESGSSLALDRSVVRDVQPDMEGLAGFGALVTDGSIGEFHGSVISGNNTAGVGAGDDGTYVTMECSLVTDTSPGLPAEDGSTCGDGVAAWAGAYLHVASSLLSGNARAGALYDHASGAFWSNVATGNAWGLVIQESQVQWDEDWNDLAGNGIPWAGGAGLAPPETDEQ
jgi:hypothetical protein